MWQMKVKQEAKKAELYIYDSVYKGDDWTSSGWEPHEASAKGVKDFLDENKDADVITVHINSLGGDVMEGTAIFNQLRAHPAKIDVVVDGFACSVASVIAMAGDTVRMPKNAMMMIHNCWTWAIGNASELRKLADDLDKIMAGNRTAYLDKAGDKLTESKLIELLDAESYLTADECLELGLCDVVEERETKLEIKDTSPDQVQAKIAAHIKQLGITPEPKEESPPEPTAQDDIDTDEPKAQESEQAPRNEALNFLAAFATAAAERDRKNG